MQHRYLAIAIVMFITSGAGSRVSAQSEGSRNFVVMSQNVYIGADLTTLLTDSPVDLFDNMANVLRRVRRTDFEQRAAAMADQIEANRPLLVGLQEVALWRTDTPADGPFSSATNIEFDFLQMLMDELQSRGLNYRVLTVSRGFNIEAPASFSNDLVDVRFTDRDAIIGRVTSQFTFDNISNRRFTERFEVPTGFFDDLQYPRFWQSVDVRVNGTNQRFRFINTHLEVFSSEVNLQQAEQLLDRPADTNLPVVMVGDFNATPGSDTHDAILSAGFVDVWELERPDQSGFTCCQPPNLTNDNSRLRRRIDYVFARGIETRSVKLIGQRDSHKTDSGLWPSDHAGIIARLTIE